MKKERQAKVLAYLDTLAEQKKQEAIEQQKQEVLFKLLYIFSAEYNIYLLFEI